MCKQKQFLRFIVMHFYRHTSPCRLLC